MNQNYINSICYIVLAKGGEVSYFNEYSINLIDNTCIFEKICELPKDLSELFYDKEHLISNRISGIFDGYNVRILSNPEHVNRSPFSVNIVFISSLSDLEGIAKDVIFFSKNIRTNVGKKIFNISDVDKGKLLEIISDLSNGFSESNRKYFNELREVTFIDERLEFLATDDSYIKSIYTRANLAVLTSSKIKYSYENYKFNFEIDDQIEPIDRILMIKSHILKKLTPQVWLPQVDFIVSDMSNDFKFFLEKDEFKPNALVNKGMSDGKLLADTIKLINQNNIPEIFSDNKYLNDYYEERKFIESLISLRSASHVSVCMTLPISNSSFYSKLKDIGVVDRKGNSKKINKMLLKLVNEFNKTTKDWFHYLDGKYSSNIKVVSNLPIEWSIHERLPLMVRHEVSRIPKSPGGVSTKLILDTEQISLKIDSFRKVKIISSFSDGDPIKDHLKEKIELLIKQGVKPTAEQISQLVGSNTLTEGMKNDVEEEENLDISIDWSNVSNKQELINSLNNNDAAITIFDLHGGHSEKGVGTIKLKDEIVTVYDLVGEVKMSPIVILSSCDTSPIDRNHNTTSNAFFLAGAKTVLASALPLTSHEASIFITRLLLRVKHYLPKRLAGNEGISIRWSSFVTGMTRKTYYSEFLSLLHNNHGLSKENKYNLNFYAGIHLDPLHENWHEKIMNEISEKANISDADLNRIIKDEFMLPECLKYIQMGNPESIIIVSDKHIPLVV